MANPALVVTANGIGLSLNGVTIDPAGATPNQGLVFNGTAFVPSPVASSIGNWVFSGNNADLSAAGVMGIGVATATAIQLGKTTGGLTTTSYGSFVQQAQPSTSGATLQNSPSSFWQMHYWNGADQFLNFEIKAVADSTAPTGHFSFLVGGGEKLQLTNAGNLFIPGGSGIDAISAGSLFVGANTATSVVIGSSNINTTLGGQTTGTGAVKSVNAFYNVNTAAATSGAQLQNSNVSYWQGAYWTGAASNGYFGAIQLGMDSTAPTGHLTFAFGQPSVSEVARISSAGIFGVIPNGGLDTITAGILFIGQNVATRVTIGSGSTTTTIDLGTGSATSAINVGSAATTLNLNSGLNKITQATLNGLGNNSALKITGGSFTNSTASTEINGFWYNARTIQWATGAIATQREFLILAPTYSFVGASTITNAATLAISGAPAAGTNATITNAYALWVQGGTTRLDGTSIILGANVVFDVASGAINFTGGNLSNFITGVGMLPQTDNSGQVGRPDTSKRFNSFSSYWYDAKLSTALASAATITPASCLHHVTGTTTISTIATTNLPTSGNVSLTLIFDGVAPWNAAGNIAVAGTPTTVGTAVTFQYDATAAKWYPSRTS